MKLCKSHILAVFLMMLLFAHLLGQSQQPILDINANLVGLEAQTSQPQSYLPSPSPPTHTSLGGQIEINEMFKSVDRYRTFHYNTELVNLNENNIGQTIGLTFFDDSFYTADILSVTKNYLGRTIITAKINDTDFAHIIIIASENTITISAKLPENDEYFFASVKHGQAYLGQVKLSELEKDRVSCLVCEEHHDLGYAHLSPNSELRTPNFHNDDNVSIDLLYVYTPLAVQWALTDWRVTDIDDLIDVTLSDTNFIHTNSNTGINFNIVHRHLTNYVETNTSLDLERITYPDDGYMDEVHDLRNTYYADLIVFLARISYTGGAAWLLNSFSGFSPDYHAVSINRVQQASWTYTVAHEIGHNMGAHHHRDQLVQPGPNNDLGNYSSGWRGSIQGALRNTVMTYGFGGYWQDGLNSTDIPYFSTPLVTVNGVVIGDATLYDNARILRETKVVTAGYRTPPYQNDLYAQSITGSTSIPINTPAIYTIRVINSGQNTASGYTVRLMRVGSSSPLYTVNGANLIAGSFLDFNLSWTPIIIEVNQLYGEVVWTLDEHQINNQTALLNVSVHPEGDIYSENFNSGTSLPAIGWGDTLNGFSGIFPLSGVNRSNGLVLHVTQGTNNIIQIAYTPTISSITSDAELYLAYRIIYYTSSWGGPLTAGILETGDEMHIEVSTTGATGTYTSIRQINSSNHTSSLNFTTITQPLSAYNGQNINIRFRAVRGTVGGVGLFFVLDDVVLSSGGQTVTVSGVVISSDTNAGVPSASVTLSGPAVYGPVTTSSTGAFTIPNVSVPNPYLLTINASGYVAHTDGIIVGTTDLNLGNIMIFEVTYPPRNVVATIDSENQSVLVQWQEPYLIPLQNWFSHSPSSTVHGGLGHGDQGGLGTVEIAHRFTQAQLNSLGIIGAALSKISFVATNFTTQPIINFGTVKVRAYVGGSGSPYNPGTMVHEQIVPISDVIYNIDPTATGIPAQWTDVNLSAPVSIPTTGELWITVLFENHDGFPCGRDNIGDQVNGFGNIFSYNGGTWSVITIGYPPFTSNFMIRGQAFVGGREVIIQPISYTIDEQLGNGLSYETVGNGFIRSEKDFVSTEYILSQQDFKLQTGNTDILSASSIIAGGTPAFPVSASNISSDTRGSRALTGYNVYRSTVANIGNPSLWVTIQENIPHVEGQYNYSLVDNDWGTLIYWESYFYIVRSVYSNNNLSNPALSGVLIKNSPDIVYIGNYSSTMTQNTIPVNNWWHKSISQTIYYDNEIPQSGVITHLTCRFTSTGNMTQGMLAPVQVYLAPTTQTTFPNTTSWVPVDIDTWVKVWDAPFPYQPGSTTQTYNLTIPLTDIYVHNGGNLAITVVKNWTAYDGQNNVFQQTETPSINRSIHARKDAGADYDPITPGTATGTLQYYPNIMLTVAPLYPPNPAVNPIPQNNAIDIPLTQALSWSQNPLGIIPTGYKIHFGTTNPPPLVESNWTTMTWTPSPALQYDMTYYWQIIPFNNTGEASDCPIWSFTTVPGLPIFSINPESHNFGNVVIDQSSPPQTFTITNTGTETLTISSVTIPGSHGFTLGNVTNLPWDIFSGGNRTFTVTFSPTSNGYQSANIEINDNVMNAEIRMQNAEISPHTPQAIWGGQNIPNSKLRTPNSNRTTHQVYLEGIGIPPLPKPAINPNPANNATLIPLSQVLSWETGTRSAPPMKNEWGGEGGAISELRTPNSEFRTPTGYKIHFGTTNPPPLVESNWTTLSWTPTPALQHGTTYYWQIIPFNATGDAVGCPVWSFTTIPNPPVFSINPTSHNFGSITVGQTSAPYTFTITNTGGSSLEISSITLAGINQNEFNLFIDGLPWTLEANISRQFSVSFTPQAPAGTKTANLSITHNAAGSPHTSVILTGDCVVSEGDVVILPTELLGNFPNPFNPITIINFIMATEGVVSIEIFDIRGSKVRLLADRVFSAGTHQIEWEGLDDTGRELGSGVYFYRMRTEEYVGVRRMVLLK